MTRCSGAVSVLLKQCTCLFLWCAACHVVFCFCLASLAFCWQWICLAHRLRITMPNANTHNICDQKLTAHTAKQKQHTHSLTYEEPTEGQFRRRANRTGRDFVWHSLADNFCDRSPASMCCFRYVRSIRVVDEQHTHTEQTYNSAHCAAKHRQFERHQRPVAYISYRTPVAACGSSMDWRAHMHYMNRTAVQWETI